MNPRTIALCTVVGLAFQLAIGQTNLISSGSDLITFLNSDLDYIENQMDRYSKIEGSAYLDEEFQEGSLSINQKEYVNILLRYNSYEGYFEFKTPEAIKYFDPRLTSVDTVWLGGNTYLYVDFQFGKGQSKTYMKLAGGSSTKVFSYDQMILSQAEPAKGYEDAKPARFKPLAEKIYIQRQQEVCTEFKGKKNMEEIFPDHHSQLSKYAKSEKLKLKNVGDVIRLCRHFDSLQ
jgi:hypothetical protein